jgi:hypothetical protein
VSNYLAIATVTSVLSQLIGVASDAAVPGAGVTTQRPGTPSGNSTPDSGPHVNLYLYQVSPNAAWRGDDLPTRDPSGGLVRRPRAALDLFYLLTFFGDEAQLEPQRILGSVATALHARPVLTRENIRSVVRTAVTTDPNHFLAESDLADQVELVKFSPLPLNLEELSKLWSVFLQTPYSLSVAYQGSVVLLEADGSPRQAAPVRERNVYVEPMRRPVIEELLSRQGPNDPPAAGRPIVASDQLVIRGTQLRGDDTQVLVGGVEAPSLEEVSNTRIILSIPTGVQAGTRAVRVVNRAMIGTPPSPHAGVESNPISFQLRPRITAPVNANVQGSGNQPRSGEITVQLSPEVGRTQRVTLLLNEKQPSDTRPPRSHTFEAPSRTQPTDPETSSSVTIPVSGLAAGEYLVRVRVDGAESILETDASGVYDAPEVEIP